jgi:predicted Rossmann fold flavoprotein
MKILVLGGGAAGMIAAWRAASLGHRVTLLEANARLGVKLRISGGGKCNITHDGAIKELLAAFPKDQARFLRPALHRFSNEDVLALLRREDVQTYTRDNGRVFPLDRPGSAAAVVAAFETILHRAGAELRTGARVTALKGTSPKLESVLVGEEALTADAFILATGGASYPETGTRGEVLGWLKSLGVSISPWFPALAPIPLMKPRPNWEGVALREGALTLSAGEGAKRLARFQGDLLFTKAGITGPAALELSRPTEEARRAQNAFLSYVLDDRAMDLIDAEAQTVQRGNPQQKASSWLLRWFPERLCEPLILEAGLNAEQRMKDLPKEARQRLVRWITAFPLGAPRAVPLERGEVAAGGVELNAVDPHTMKLRGWENLFVCGELLNVDGPVGGYNLQAAFSTGFVAGDVPMEP